MACSLLGSAEESDNETYRFDHTDTESKLQIQNTQALPRAGFGYSIIYFSCYLASLAIERPAPFKATR